MTAKIALVPFEFYFCILYQLIPALLILLFNYLYLFPNVDFLASVAVSFCVPHSQYLSYKVSASSNLHCKMISRIGLKLMRKHNG